MRTQQVRRMIALFCIVLIGTLPIVFAQQLRGGTLSFASHDSTSSPSEPLTLNTTFPTIVRDHSVDLVITTLAGVRLEIFVNEELKRTVPQVLPNGVYKAFNIPLPLDDNSIKVEAIRGGEREELTGNIIVDMLVPDVQLIIPSIARTSPLTLQGSTTKDVTVKHRVLTGTTTPDIIGGVLLSLVDNETIRLTWAPSSHLEIAHYIIYRNGERIAIVQPRTDGSPQEFVDTTIGADHTYEYMVTAITNGCRESDASEKETITMPTGGDAEDSITVITLQSLGCEFVEEQYQKGDFSISFDVDTTGQNTIEFIAEDRAGNTVRLIKDVFIDTKAPQFIPGSVNLNRITPSYDPFITVRGQTDEEAAITVLVNGQPEKTRNTDKDGRFSIELTLSRDPSIKTSFSDEETTDEIEIDTGLAWDNAITLIATDAAGNTEELGPESVVLATCGVGNWYSTEFGDINPEVLNPRLLLDGLQHIGFSFEFDYTGRYNATIDSININAVPLSASGREKYDNDLISVTPVYSSTPDGKIKGYATINVKSLESRLDIDEDLTTFEKEEILSNYRSDECLSGQGCMRFLIVSEIQFKEQTEVFQPTNRDLRVSLSDYDIEPLKQRNCIGPVEVMIDKRIPPKVIPRHMLQKVSDILEDVIENMEKVLKPLTTIATYLIYGCLVSGGSLFLMKVDTSLSCTYNNVALKILGTPWDKGIAQIGQCESVYADDDDARNACLSCQNALEREKSFTENVFRPLCNRVACPSAPSWQKHIKDAGGSVQEVKVDSSLFANHPELAKWTVGSSNKIFTGNDCAVKDFKGVTFGMQGRTYNDLLPTYEFYKGVPGLITNKITPEDCKNPLRPAHPLCCATEYMERWGSACGIGPPLTNRFDEIKESMCLAAQEVHLNELPTGETCSSLWNSAAGFCEPAEYGKEVPDPIPTGVTYTETQASAIGNQPYIIVIPVERDIEDEPRKYEIYMGYVAETFSFEKRKDAGEVTETSRGAPAGGASDFIKSQYLNAESGVVLRAPITSTFFDTAKDTAIPVSDSKASELQRVVCAEAGRGSTTSNPTKDCEKRLSVQQASNLYTRVLNSIDTSANSDSYIVKPDEGILRSIECGCVPATIRWIDRWRQILQITKTCIDTIEATGDGSAGACEAFLSQYACDMFYEALRCFVQKFGTPGGGTNLEGRGGLPFGDIFGAISEAGRGMNKEITESYGETGLYQSLFNDRKLVNSVCLFAFTGTWNLDASALVGQSLDQTPIPSQGLIQPCGRRFNGYNQNTQPPGLVNWLYNFNIVLIPGTDIDYKVELVCSEGFRCDPSAGFVNGECDCNKIGEQRLPIRPRELRGQLRQGDEPLNVNVFHLVNALRPEGTPLSSRVRYDKAVLSWTSQDPKITIPSAREGSAECTIRLLGGDAPSECRWDFFTTSYRCQFGFTNSQIAIIDAEADYDDIVIEGTTREAFGITTDGSTSGDVTLSLDLRQSFPSNTDEQLAAIKYLGYKILNQNRDVVRQVPAIGTLHPEEFRLETNGDYERKVVIENVVTEANFEERKVDSSTVEHILWTPDGVTRTSGYIPGSSVSAEDITPTRVGTLPSHFLIAFEKDTFTVFESDGTVTGAGGRFHRRTRRIGPPNMPIDNYVRSGEPRGLLDQLGQYRVWFDLSEKPRELVTHNRVEILVPTGVTHRASINPCGSTPPLQTEWLAIFDIYNADEYGDPTPNVAIDSTTGKSATKTVPFFVACGNTEEKAVSAARVAAVRSAVVKNGNDVYSIARDTYYVFSDETPSLSINKADDETITIKETNPDGGVTEYPITGSDTIVSFPLTLDKVNEYSYTIRWLRGTTETHKEEFKIYMLGSRLISTIKEKTTSNDADPHSLSTGKDYQMTFIRPITRGNVNIKIFRGTTLDRTHSFGPGKDIIQDIKNTIDEDLRVEVEWFIDGTLIDKTEQLDLTFSS